METIFTTKKNKSLQLKITFETKQQNVQGRCDSYEVRLMALERASDRVYRLCQLTPI